VTTLQAIAFKLLKGELPAIAAQDLARERLKACAECAQFKKLARQCDLCGCFMDVKAYLLNSSCPLEKW